jgi:hypothetical protein
MSSTFGVEIAGSNPVTPTSENNKLGHSLPSGLFIRNSSVTAGGAEFDEPLK